MTEEKILEIARQHGSIGAVRYVSGDPSQTIFEFCYRPENLIAFARAVIKEERTRVNQIIDDGYRQGGHLKWLCAIAIVERIKEEEK